MINSVPVDKKHGYALPDYALHTRDRRLANIQGAVLHNFEWFSILRRAT